MRRIPEYHYTIPINEQVDGGTVTCLSIKIQDDSPVRRGAYIRRIFRKNYGLTRQQAKDALRAMNFNTLIT